MALDARATTSEADASVLPRRFGNGTDAPIPGLASSFTMTMNDVSKTPGATMHPYTGAGGCRKEGLYFSTTTPREYLEWEWDVGAWGLQPESARRPLMMRVRD